MAIIVSSIKTSVEYDSEEPIMLALSRVGVNYSKLKSGYIIKTSLDARKRDNIQFVHTVGLELDIDEQKLCEKLNDSNVTIKNKIDMIVEKGSKKLNSRPVIAGFGPAGMFAALLLAQNGYRPIVLERGASIDERVTEVNNFFNSGRLNTQTNVQFGEGGAGTFSDGKLTTRINDERCGYVLEQFNKFGAPDDILQKAKPHIGTDKLRQVVKEIRTEIIKLGGEVRFLTQLTDFNLVNGRLCSVKAQNDEINAEVLIFCVGHSARDTFKLLAQKPLTLEAKPFSVGVRIEHLQQQIDKGLYGLMAGHKALPPGEYQLSYREGERGVYTFCMCPGGFVVPAASEENTAVTNGMSEYARNGKNANSAVVVSVDKNNYGSGALDGMYFQQKLEQAAFAAGGKAYKAPAQTVGAFLSGKVGLDIKNVEPSYAIGVTAFDFNRLFPADILSMLKKGLTVFDKKISGFAAPDAVLTGVETRTSSPVRVMRGDDMQAAGVQGIYPCGEGAGYAGGIVSAAVDGIKAAQAVMKKYAPFE